MLDPYLGAARVLHRIRELPSQFVAFRLTQRLGTKPMAAIGDKDEYQKKENAEDREPSNLEIGKSKLVTRRPI